MRALTGHFRTGVNPVVDLRGVVPYHQQWSPHVCVSVRVGPAIWVFGPFRALFLISQASPQGETLVTMRA